MGCHIAGSNDVPTVDPALEISDAQEVDQIIGIGFVETLGAGTPCVSRLAGEHVEHRPRTVLFLPEVVPLLRHEMDIERRNVWSKFLRGSLPASCC